MTGLVIISTGVWNSGLTDSLLSIRAFEKGFPLAGRYIVLLGLILFAYSTTITWSYYGDRCCSYLFGLWVVPWYRWVYTIFLVIGASIRLETVWCFADITNGLMAIPNLIALIGLSGTTWKITKDYFERT
jgi:AGCS family alanine or glycine:cation symporter